MGTYWLNKTFYTTTSVVHLFKHYTFPSLELNLDHCMGKSKSSYHQIPSVLDCNWGLIGLIGNAFRSQPGQALQCAVVCMGHTGQVPIVVYVYLHRPEHTRTKAYKRAASKHCYLNNQQFLHYLHVWYPFDTYVGCSAINGNGLVSPKVKIAWQRLCRKLKTQV